MTTGNSPNRITMDFAKGAATGTTERAAVVITLGVFDGCHRGHQALIHEVCKMATRLRAAPVVVTFDPHPDEIVRSCQFQERLFLLQDNVNFLKGAGASEILVLPFDLQMAEQTAEEFLEAHVLSVGTLKGLVIGHDFALGKGRQGGGEFLRKWCSERQVEFCQVEPLKHDGEILSTSGIRERLRDGRTSEANGLLGRNYFLRGVVVEGQKLGRQLEFPTANLRMSSPFVPAKGVYFSRMNFRGQWAFAATNVGVRPTVDGLNLVVESHLLDTDENLYGEDVKVELLTHLRGEVRFAGLPELQTQIRLDIEEVRRRMGEWLAKI